MEVSFVIAPDRPLGEMPHQGAPSHIKACDPNAGTFSFGWVDERASSISDEVGIPHHKAAAFRPARRSHKIIRAAVEPLVKIVITTKNKVAVVQEIDHQRRTGHG